MELPRCRLDSGRYEVPVALVRRYFSRVKGAKNSGPRFTPRTAQHLPVIEVPVPPGLECKPMFSDEAA